MAAVLTNIAAESTGTTSAWFALAGALGGVLITSAIALLTAILNQRSQARSNEGTLRWEHTKQLRQDRLETYAHYLSAWNRLTQQYLEVRNAIMALDSAPKTEADAKTLIPIDVSAELRAADVAWRDAWNLAFLIAGKDVEDALRAQLRSTVKRMNDAWKGEYTSDAGTHLPLTNAMKAEIIDYLSERQRTL
jgi:hypothetical protein